MALNSLCQAYWAPVYAFIRRRGHDPHEAEDLTQGFFEKMVSGNYLSTATPAKGRFRTFLITMLVRYLANEWDKTQRLKRGGGIRFVSLSAGEAEGFSPIDPASPMTPEKEYERRWVETLLERCLVRLESDYRKAGIGRRFEVLKIFLTDPKGTMPLSEAARDLELSEPAVKSAIFRLRAQYREALQYEIAQTVSGADEVEDELRNLFAALAS